MEIVAQQLDRKRSEIRKIERKRKGGDVGDGEIKVRPCGDDETFGDNDW